MENENLASFCGALKLDENPLQNQLMFVEELGNADGSFVLSMMIKHLIGKKQNIVLVTCHNSWGHFHSIGLKLGYNLTLLKEAGHIYFLDILEAIKNDDFLTTSRPLRKLYSEIKKQADVWKNSNGVCILIENLGNFLFVDAEEFLSFVNYLRVITKDIENSSVVFSVHNFPDCPNFNKIAKSIRHLADLTVVLQDLQTGRASDVTGHLTVIRKMNNFKINTFQYQYQLQDKSIRIFVPGFLNLH